MQKDNVARIELIAALEAADGDSRDLMLAAWRVIFGEVNTDSRVCPDYVRFFDMLRAEAWESAALMLVPEGCAVDLSIDDNGFSEVALTTEHDAICATGATPALAIVIAALKAGGEG